MVVNRKKLCRLCKEEKLTVRKRGGCKRALRTRPPMTIQQGANQRWSVDFPPDTYCAAASASASSVPAPTSHGEGMATIVDNSISGEQVARKPGQHHTTAWFSLPVVSDRVHFQRHAPAAQDQRVRRHYIAPGKPCRTA